MKFGPRNSRGCQLRSPSADSPGDPELIRGAGIEVSSPARTSTYSVRTLRRTNRFSKSGIIRAHGIMTRRPRDPPRTTRRDGAMRQYLKIASVFLALLRVVRGQDIQPPFKAAVSPEARRMGLYYDDHGRSARPAHNKADNRCIRVVIVTRSSKMHRLARTWGPR